MNSLWLKIKYVVIVVFGLSLYILGRKTEQNRDMKNRLKETIKREEAIKAVFNRHSNHSKNNINDAFNKHFGG